MLDNTETAAAIQADIDSLRERFPRTADLYREACAVMFFRYGKMPTTNSLYQLVRKGSMSVPTEALRQFWSDLRERARVDLQHADVPEQLKQSAGQLVGEIWTLARKAAEESIAVLRESAVVDRDKALAEKNRLESQVAQLSAELTNARAQTVSAEALAAKQRGELSAGAEALRELNLRLAEAHADSDRLGSEMKDMSTAHAAKIDRITSRILKAEDRYAGLEKRTLTDLDRERTAVAKLQEQLDAERRTSASRVEAMHAQAQADQIQLTRQGQELGTYMAKVELLADERDRTAQQAAKSELQRAELDSALAVERARVLDLREQLERITEASKPAARQSRIVPAIPPKRRRKPSTSSK